jgi:rod shape-determining protein MreD
VKQTARVLLAIGVALVAQSLLARGLGDARLYVDLPLVAVVWAALSGGRVAGLLGGTLAGLAQDAAGGGVLGVSGLAKSLAGFLAGVTGTQFIVTQTLPRVLVFMGATGVSAGLFMALYAMLGLRQFERAWLDILLQATSNGLVGALIFEVADVLPGMRERWRVRREYRQRARFR